MGSVEGFDVEGPVQAEVFVLFLDESGINLTGPCGSDPWYIESHGDEDPLDVVTRVVRTNIGEPVVVHSTSWRRGRDAVLLSFVVVIEPVLVGDMDVVPIDRTELARNTATSAPGSILSAQVVEHGLRHLAWLVRDDPVVARELSNSWKSVLAGYTPEPFRHLTKKERTDG